MTRREYDFLLSVRIGAVPDWRELGREDIGLLTSMKRDGFVFMDAGGRVTIEPEGFAALSAYEEQLHRLSDQTKEKAKQDAQEKAWRLADSPPPHASGSRSSSSTVTSKKSATSFRRSTVGEDFSQPRIVAFPTPTSRSSFATEIPVSRQSLTTFS